jgi:hypothetical protein
MRPPIDKLAFLMLPLHVRGCFPNAATSSTTSLGITTCMLDFPGFSIVLVMEVCALAPSSPAMMHADTMRVAYGGRIWPTGK